MGLGGRTDTFTLSRRSRTTGGSETPTITVRVSEGMKAEVETLVEDTGLWPTESNFIREALDTLIRRYWKGDRFCQRPQLERSRKESN